MLARGGMDRVLYSIFGFVFVHIERNFVWLSFWRMRVCDLVVMLDLSRITAIGCIFALS